MKKNALLIPLLFVLPLMFTASCKKKETATPSNVANTSNQLPDIYKHFTSNVTVTRDGNYVVITTDGIPDYKSPYFPKTDSMYTPYNGSNPNFHKAPNLIEKQHITFRIPLYPHKADKPQSTPLGPIGIALNGVVFFNQYNGPGQPLGKEINSFDQYNGHPNEHGIYHYHVEPLYLTKTLGKDALLGFLMDGYPVYGPEENGKEITDTDLDSLHGHFGITADYPNGIYHYHITAAAPYINGDGFYGVPGTVTE